MSSEVVAWSEPAPGVVVLTLQDKANRNTLTRELTRGLLEAYRQVGDDDRVRAVVLTGYGSYFCCGGTREDLLTLQAGEHFFDEVDVMRPALRCPVPVISAMQGHALGGGLSMGLFSDFVFLSRESVYSASFMQYGFTPGMGATYIVPKRMGFNLGLEMLMNGDDFLGADLQARGVPLPVFPRKEVLAQALKLANGLAAKPRGALALLKAHFVKGMLAELDEAVKCEIEMHKRTLHMPEMRERIEAAYAGYNAPGKAPP